MTYDMKRALQLISLDTVRVFGIAQHRRWP